MVAGELVAEGTPAKSKIGRRATCWNSWSISRSALRYLLKKTSERWRVSLFGDRLHVITDEEAQAGIQNTTQELAQKGIRVLSVREERFSLEDVFISVVERRANKEKWPRKIEGVHACGVILAQTRKRTDPGCFVTAWRWALVLVLPVIILL